MSGAPDSPWSRAPAQAAVESPALRSLRNGAVPEAIERRDPVTARALMQQHVIRAGALVTLRFEERATSA